MVNILENNDIHYFEESRLDTYIDFNRGQCLRIGVRGPREYLDTILDYLRYKSFNIIENGTTREMGNFFSIPETLSDKGPGYVVVVDSTGDWDNHTMNKSILSINDLKIKDTQNAIFISWTSDINESSGGGAEWDGTFHINNSSPKK